MSNKRKNERFSCLVPVEAKQGTVFEDAATVDFSKKGFGLISQYEMPVNKEIPVEIVLKEQDDSVFVIASVRWVQRLASPDRFRIGVYFKNFLRGSKTRLNQHFAHIK